MLIQIDTPTDPALAAYTGLTDTALRAKREVAEGLFIAESFTVIERAIDAGYRPDSILVTEKWRDRVNTLEQTHALEATPIFIGPESIVTDITGFHVHRGALAAMRRRPQPALADLLANAQRVLVLEDLVDHTNVGAAIRSAAAIGMDAIVVSPRCADPLYRRAIRVSMGTVFQVPWTRCPTWPVTHALRTVGFTSVALALREDAINLDEFTELLKHSSADAAKTPLPSLEKVALIVGPEGHGLDPRSIADAEYVVKIPMAHGVDSLNVAAAAAVGCWALQSGRRSSNE